MKILVKFPTRGRSDLFFKTLDLYYSMALDKENLFFLVSLDEDDPDMSSFDVNEKLLSYENLMFIYGKSKNKIHAVNRDLELFEDRFDIILLASDDMIPQVQGYDEIIRDKMKELYPDTDGILFFNDGFKKNVLNTLCILGEKYYKRFGYIYYPGYVSLWADNEFMEVGYLLKKQTYIDHCIIKHEHPDHGFTAIPRDNIHVLNNKFYDVDKNLFEERKSKNFDL